MTTVAGDPHAPLTESAVGDGGPATAAGIAPDGLAVDLSGNLLIADYGHDRIRRVAADGTITTIAGRGPASLTELAAPRLNLGDGGPASAALIEKPTGIVVTTDGTLYLLAAVDLVRKIASNQTISSFAGRGSSRDPAGRAATEFAFGYPLGMTIGPDGSFYFLDVVSLSDGSNGPRILKLTRDSSGVFRFSLYAGGNPAGFSGDGGSATVARLNFGGGLSVSLNGIVADSAGVVYFSDQGNHRVRRIAANGTIDTCAGNGTAGFSGDGGPAKDATLHSPAGLALDRAGNLYIADQMNMRIRKVTANCGTISTFAGRGPANTNPIANVGDHKDGPADQAMFTGPKSLAIDQSGNIYVSESYGEQVRKIYHTDNCPAPAAAAGGSGTPTTSPETQTAPIVNNNQQTTVTTDNGTPDGNSTAATPTVGGGAGCALLPEGL